ncbi:MAG: hypothetical protein ACWGNV_04955, partial [Bacteroidales bacterium]
MKTFIPGIVLLVLLSTGLRAQTHLNLGGGYFGQTLSHPGLVLELELENSFSERASLPVRFDIGTFVHPRNHYGLFFDASFGFRQYFRSGLFVEEGIGAGIFQSWLHSDQVYEVDDAGVVSETSRINPPDFMPSLTLGLGYNLTRDSGKRNLIWLRPKIYWQVPHKTTA